MRSYELNDEYSKFKSYSLDPFPECQMKKRNTDTYRNQRNDDEETNEEIKKTDCNGGVNISQRSSDKLDHIPLLVNTNRKRWHSLEMVGSGADVGGCEELVDRNSKKSVKSNMIKSWLVGIFSSNNGLKGSTRNGSGILLQQPTTIANQITKPEETSIV